MAILVTGGTGYIGSHTVVELVKQGEKIVIVDNLSNSDKEVLHRIQKICNLTNLEDQIAFYELDLLNEDGLRQLFLKEEIQSVIHFAGYKAVGESVSKPIEYYMNNLTGTLVLLKVMKEFHVKKMVFSSSATVYGLTNTSPLTEELPLSATNPYGYTKVMIEQILRDVGVADPEFSIVLLRYFNPIGAHESGEIGENPSGVPNNLMPYITQVAIGKREFLSIYGKDYDTVDGTGVRDYIHVVDLAQGHLAALKYLDAFRGVDAINLGTGNGVSVLELLHAFEETNQVKIAHQFVERRPGDIATCYADASKAKKELEWIAKKTIADMCRDSWRWQQKNPNGYQQ
ncbi:MAG: UDP-glucose 4-epimerase GalE [Vallitaleaceae bacterium]|nr:UDP-glucose 4-epimerase GalE [Vallitaleaceae bacterium]